MIEDRLDRQRRALYRASRRGTKEMDWLLGRYADARVAGMSEAALLCFEALIEVPDPDLHAAILEVGAIEPCFETMLADIRAFHGFAGAP